MELRLRIRDLREDNDMNQAEMAKLLGVLQQTYSRYESHTTEIPFESLIWLAEHGNFPSKQTMNKSRDLRYDPDNLNQEDSETAC